MITALDEAALVRLAQLIAFTLRVGDCITLTGDLGAGKTTFARALITALSHPRPVEVPSPTFTLVQTYRTPRLGLAHFDLYRLNDASELDELGLDEILSGGAAVIEWPERAQGRIGGTRLDLDLAERQPDGATRDVTIHAHGTWAPRIERLLAISHFLARSGLGDADVAYLQGDASVRRYARLSPRGAPPVILMDWPTQPDGPPIRQGLPYSRIAHLAEGVRPFAAIAEALRASGLSTPLIHAHDLDAGLLVIEDFGDRVFSSEIKAAGDQSALWEKAVDVLVALRRVPPPDGMLLPGGGAVRLPTYDAPALLIETELLLDWYWPHVYGSAVPADLRAEYAGLWGTLAEGMAKLPAGWVLRDYHSPNLIHLPDRAAPLDVGVIDFQDAQIGPYAYDLVSLLQDARVDVDADLEARLLAHYCQRVALRDPGFSREVFQWSYAVLGAQRNSKILGIFARLARRDGKPQYLAHMPRIWRYLERDLAHPQLARLKTWYDRAFPVQMRTSPAGARAPQSQQATA